jgi:heme/copper-type cytochrome/quinol oxidase subunit 2
MMRRLLAAFSTVALGALCGPEILAQCAMCGAAAASGKVGRGIAFSVFFLLGILFLVVSWFVVLVYRAQRNAGQAPGGTPPPAGK